MAPDASASPCAGAPEAPAPDEEDEEGADMRAGAAVFRADATWPLSCESAKGVR